MQTYDLLYPWLSVFCAILGTIVWRFAGVILAAHIPADSPLMDWVNTMAYAMVSGVLMLIMVHPTGVLATTSLEQRLLGLFVGLSVIFFTKNLIFALLCGIGSFALAVSFIPASFRLF